MEGAVPAGTNLASTEDPSLRGSILNTWPDGSARNIVVAGNKTGITANSSVTLTLHPAVVADTPLALSDITALFSTGISVDFGVGVQNLNTWTSPDRIWWKNGRLICARYRLACGLGVLEAVIDVHSFGGGNGVVEVVVENAKLTSSNAVATKPVGQAYTNATVSVNGIVIATVSDPPAGMLYQGQTLYAVGTHSPFRAWYCSAEIRAGVVFIPTTAQEKASWFGIETTHEIAAMQAHPIFYKVVRPIGFDPATFNVGPYQAVTQPFGNDAYQPWYYGRLVGYNMGQGGDPANAIGLYTMWDASYLQSGHKACRRAVIANTLVALHYGINYRESTTNLVPTFAHAGSKTRNAPYSWPETSEEPRWEAAHQPNVGVMAFLCRPSPCFIEIAQKAANWSGTYSDPIAIPQAAYQTRGIAWNLKTMGMALFLTPTTTDDTNVNAWADAVIPTWAYTLDYITQRKDHATQKLSYCLNGYVGKWLDFRRLDIGFQQSTWEHIFLTTAITRLAPCKLFGSQQTRTDAIADWSCEHTVRYVNESVAGEWRFYGYRTTLGVNNYDEITNNGYWGSGVYEGPDPGSFPTYGENFAWFFTEPPPAEVGGLTVPKDVDGLSTRLYSDSTVQTRATAGLDYTEHHWMGICCAAERNIAGAQQMWDRVMAGLVGTHTGNLAVWLDGFENDARKGFWPRNKAEI